MTIENALKLLQLEDENRLRNPNSIANFSPEELDDLNSLQNIIIMAIRQIDGKKFKRIMRFVCANSAEIFLKIKENDIELDKENTTKLLVKLTFEMLPNVNRLTGEGTRVNPYKIDTIYGKGLFFDAKYLFDDDSWPRELKDNSCYVNSNYLLRSTSAKLKPSTLTGICYRNGAYLHSVLKIKLHGKNFILDSNYHLCMEEDLYLKLFPMEILNEITKINMTENEDTFKKLVSSCHIKNKDINMALLMFAFDDLMVRAKDKTNEQNIMDQISL